MPCVCGHNEDLHQAREGQCLVTLCPCQRYYDLQAQEEQRQGMESL